MVKSGLRRGIEAIGRAALRERSPAVVGLVAVGAGLGAGALGLLLGRRLRGRRAGSRQDAAGLADGRFLRQAVRRATAGIALGHLGVQLGASEEVRELARRMLAEHSRMRSELVQLCFSRGIAPPPGAGAAQRRTLARLGKRGGRRFDRGYLDALVDAHEEALALFERGTRDGLDPALRSLAQPIHDRLREHLQDAESLRDRREDAPPPPAPSGPSGGQRRSSPTSHASTEASTASAASSHLGLKSAPDGVPAR